VAPVIRDVCAAVQASSKETEFVLDLDNDAVAVIDAGALRQVVLNLLDNALKYGPKSQRISVALTARDDAVQLSVRDEGPGIPEQERERVWSPFYRLAREQHKAISGTGIGLAVVRELVMAMQGCCRVADSEHGTEVVIEFPGGADRA